MCHIHHEKGTPRDNGSRHDNHLQRRPSAAAQAASTGKAPPGSSSPERRNRCGSSRRARQPDHGQPWPNRYRGRCRGRHRRLDFGPRFDRVQLGDNTTELRLGRGGGVRSAREHGSAIVTGVIAIALLMLVFLGAVSFSLDEYAQGAVRTAVDEGAQAGAVAGGSVVACQQEAESVMSGLLHGSFGQDVKIVCSQSGSELVARGSGDLPTLVPGFPVVHVSVVGVAILEELPQQ